MTRAAFADVLGRLPAGPKRLRVNAFNEFAARQILYAAIVPVLLPAPDDEAAFAAAQRAFEVASSVYFREPSEAHLAERRRAEVARDAWLCVTTTANVYLRAARIVVDEEVAGFVLEPDVCGYCQTTSDPQKARCGCCGAPTVGVEQWRARQVGGAR